MEVKRHESGSKVVGTYLSIRLARKREMESKEKIEGGGGEGEERGDRVRGYTRYRVTNRCEFVADFSGNLR